MKTIKNVLKAISPIIIGIIATFSTGISIAQTTPTILINGTSVLASNFSVSPYWLAAGQTLAIGNLTKFISVLQYNIIAATGGNELKFESVLSVTTLQTVPAGKAWKIESAALDPSATIGSGDNWGGQSILSDATLTGIGTSTSPLGLAQQGATTGQNLQWNGSAWVPSASSGGFTSRVHAFPTNAGNHQNIPANTWTKLIMDTKEYDNLGEFNISTYRFTAQSAGYYVYNAWCQGIANTNGPGYSTLSVWKNGSRIGGDNSTYTPSGGLTEYMLAYSAISAGTIKMLAGDYLELYFYTNMASTGSNGMYPNTGNTEWYITRVQ